MPVGKEDVPPQRQQALPGMDLTEFFVGIRVHRMLPVPDNADSLSDNALDSHIFVVFRHAVAHYIKFLAIAG